MNRFLTWGAALLMVGTACRSRPTDACRVGETRACETADACEAQERCTGDPPAWGTCSCLLQGEPPRVGAACDGDSECSNDEVCLNGDGAEYLGGAPVSGTCVLPCTLDPGVCDDLSHPSVCVVTDDRGTSTTDDDIAHCFERCTLGADPRGKCHDRVDVACNLLRDSSTPSRLTNEPAAVDAGAPTRVAFCRPLCTADDECSPGAECNLATGACEESTPAGDPLGSSCDPNQTPTSCAGVCLTVNELSFCSNRCRFGSAKQCGAADAADGGDAASAGLCRFPEAYGTVGDTAFCAELCNSGAECSHADAVCSPFDDAEVEAITQRLGTCLSRLDAAGDPRPHLE